MQKECKVGFVLGKFCPFHKGHEYLIDYAINHSEKVYVVVDNIMGDYIPVKVRMDWIKKSFPQVTVLTIPKPLPQHPEEAIDFWTQWRTTLLSVLPEPINMVFASECYGERLAKEIGANYGCCIVDRDRITVPISATMLRQDRQQYWQLLSDSAKSYYCRKICVYGPESTGKSTLTSLLADYYHGDQLQEYAKDVIVEKNGYIDFDDMCRIVKGHHDKYCQKLKSPLPYFFCDTDALTSKIWSMELFGKEVPSIEYYINNQHFDLYLLLDIDLEWQDDIHRYRPNERQLFFDKCLRLLSDYHRPYRIVRGVGEQRLTNAIKQISEFFEKNV